jgi:hypothetical protein
VENIDPNTIVDDPQFVIQTIEAVNSSSLNVEEYFLSVFTISKAIYDLFVEQVSSGIITLVSSDLDSLRGELYVGIKSICASKDMEYWSSAFPPLIHGQNNPHETDKFLETDFLGCHSIFNISYSGIDDDTFLAMTHPFACLLGDYGVVKLGQILTAVIALDQILKVGHRDKNLTESELSDIAGSSGQHALVRQLRQWEIEESVIIDILSYRKYDLQSYISYLKKCWGTRNFVFLGVE